MISTNAQPKNHLMCARFRVYSTDHRPEVWPIKHPYWIEKVGENSDGEYVVLRSYAKDIDEIMEMWPNAEDIEVITSELEKYEYSGKFPKPVWFFDPDLPEGGDHYDILVVEFDVVKEEVRSATLVEDVEQLVSHYGYGLDTTIRYDFSDQPDYVPLHLPAKLGGKYAYLAIRGRFMEQIIDVYPVDVPLFDDAPVKSLTPESPEPIIDAINA